MSFRWRLFASYLLVILLAALILGLFVAQGMERLALASLQESLRAQSALLAEAVGPELAHGARTPALAQKVRDLDRQTGLRLTLVAPNGQVLADSEHDAASMENHGARPEIRRALASGLGTEIRHERDPARGLSLPRASRAPDRPGLRSGARRRAAATNPSHQRADS